MKLTIGKYEVEVNARKYLLREEMNEQDTKAFLNSICLALSTELFDEEMGMDISKALEEVGYYEDIL